LNNETRAEPGIPQTDAEEIPLRRIPVEQKIWEALGQERPGIHSADTTQSEEKK